MRAATSQKCVRAGGKHNDLDNVGYTARHHTFFEMLGNFSFGDYFKEDAIELSWNLITKEFGLDPRPPRRHRLSRRRGGVGALEEADGLPDDAHHPHRDHGQLLADGRPARAGRARRSSTTTAPRSGRAARLGEEADGDRLIEIWNLVFMQYEQVAPATARPLPKPSIDTGMGLERIAAVLQGTHDNYETDLFRALIAASVEATGVPADGRRTRPRTASSPTTCARRASSSPTACCPPTRAAATCSAGSCAAPCATRTSSAPRSR